MQLSSLSLLFGLLLASPLAGATWAAPPGERTSERIAKGIGKRYLPAGGPLAFSAWPLPLQQVTRATMASTVSPNGDLVVIAAGHPNSGGTHTIWDVA